MAGWARGDADREELGVSEVAVDYGGGGGRRLRALVCNMLAQACEGCGIGHRSEVGVATAAGGAAEGLWRRCGLRWQAGWARGRRWHRRSATPIVRCGAGRV